MTAHVVDLAGERHFRAYCEAIGHDPRAPEKPVDPAIRLEAGLRTFLAVDAALSPWSDSTLIACLFATHNDIERGAIIRELEERAWRRK